MFDSCWLWRRRLARQADGKINPKLCGRLQDHLSHCERCRKRADAEVALAEVLHGDLAYLDRTTAARMDDCVVSAVLDLYNPAYRSRAPRHELNFRYVDRHPKVVIAFQVLGGAATAAAVTVLFLAPALRNSPTSDRGDRSALRMVSSEPPAPMSSLLETSAPRAALLWGPASRSQTAGGFKRSAVGQFPVREWRVKAGSQHKSSLVRPHLPTSDGSATRQSEVGS